MLKLQQVGGIGGDSTYKYRVQLPIPVTVAEFIQKALDGPGKFGEISIKDYKNPGRGPKCTYENGDYLSEIPEDMLKKRVWAATAHGSYGRLDYELELSEWRATTAKQEGK